MKHMRNTANDVGGRLHLRDTVGHIVEEHRISRFEVRFHAVEAGEYGGEIGAAAIVEMSRQALPLFLLEAEQFSRQLPDRRLGFAALCQVPCDLRETGELARVIAQRCDDDVRPESRAVLAYAPAPVFYASERFGLMQQLCRTPALLIFRGVKAGHRLADDFAAVVALDEPSPFVPRHDLTVGTQHENRVVLHARDQQTAELVLDVGIVRCVRLFHMNSSKEGGRTSYHSKWVRV